MSVRRACLFLILAAAAAGESPPPGPVITPIPQEAQNLPGSFKVDAATSIVIGAHPTAHDRFLAQSLTAELVDDYGLALPTVETDALPPGQVILIGTGRDPAVAAAERAWLPGGVRPGREGYWLVVRPQLILVDGTDDAGAFYGLQSLRQLLAGAGPGLELAGLQIRDWPYQPIRGLKLYLPGRDQIPFFKRFISDFMALHKFNTLFVEFNGAMRLDRHPEINAGWRELFRNLASTRRDRPSGPQGQYQDSPNQDVADGGVLEKAEVADLVAWTERQHIQFVPEVPSLTHSYYLLTRHRELADPSEASWEWPDSYDERSAAAHRLYFDVLDEIMDVTRPAMVHVGHDEWRVQIQPGAGQDESARRSEYLDDLKETHDHLAARHVRMAIYGDHLLERVRGRGFSPHQTRSGVAYRWPGALTPEQVIQQVPKDILVFNWFWKDGKEGSGEANDAELEKWGFEQVYCNLTPDIANYAARSRRQGVRGGMPDSWAATTEFNFGKDLMFDFIGDANLVWSTHWPSQAELSERAQAEFPDVRRRLRGVRPPSADADLIQPMGLPAPGAPIAAPVGGQDTPVRSQPAPIPIGADASSVIFLHALAHPANNAFAYRYVYNFVDSADLLGEYEIVYQDGFVATVPIRYAVNILESSWYRHESPRTVCYEADAVDVGGQGSPETFFAFEWVNPRLGKKIKEVRLLGLSGARTPNMIFLRALSIVRPRTVAGPASTHTSDG